ncbi:hypothetical protein HYH03_015643 [Edaphochlamys debaryana]|uniref:Calcineurin-like phosphoesterase domain-containing protein n=1 Tax=Edaphochlamys debaryana TaxID=47281 RepID=A0A835XKT4_9CHLO|nr:hypothetical protein HYH03_015643 [Edaphochlamys debaryana]|eukprot:KAG2485671.1 hypothetical protein HYH03_015643 [Edaphochlamys debaryana]
MEAHGEAPTGPEASMAGPAAATAVRPPGKLKVAIVGDVHGSWRGDREEAALRLLGPDVTLLLGDFGNENVELVKQIASLPLRKAVILGNHDAWFTMTGRSMRRAPPQQSLSAADLLAAEQRGDGPLAAADGDGVTKQLAALGEEHMGYGTHAMDEQGYTVMGARPFSKGGKSFTSIKAFMGSLYGIESMDASADRIVQVASSAPPAHPLIVMGHNGPSGLGARAWDPCGVDWEPKAGDHGDPDLRAALDRLHAAGRRVPLVTFGHMHHNLHSGASKGWSHHLRRMVHLDPSTRTLFLNAATVPRVRLAPASNPVAAAAASGVYDPSASPASPSTPHSSSTSSSPRGSPPANSPPLSPKAYGSGRRARMAAKAAAAAVAASALAHPPGGSHSHSHDSQHQHGGGAGAGAGGGGDTGATLHHFMVAEFEAGEVVRARDVWVQVTPVSDGTAAAALAAAAAEVAEAEATAGPQVAAALATAAESLADADGALAASAASSMDGDGAATSASGDGDGAAAGASDAGPQRVGPYVTHVARQNVVLRTVVGANGGLVKFVWNAFDQQYEPVVLPPTDANGDAVMQEADGAMAGAEGEAGAASEGAGQGQGQAGGQQPLVPAGAVAVAAGGPGRLGEEAAPRRLWAD